ncbi:MAG: alkaline phosphatase family protein [Myxococcaceae bacterium]|nr:alkaline phosphatase family protein [Myxococcaceae bacterium]
MGLERAELIAPQLRAWAERSIVRIRMQLGEGGRVRTRRRRKLLVVHLDGVPRSVLARAIEDDRMPFLSRLVKSGAYYFDGAFWGSPASTPAFQAGLLYGVRHPNLPAYTWFDRDQARTIRMNVPRDAHLIETRVNDQARGNSLLEDGGSTYLSLFSANTANPLAISSLAHLENLLPRLWAQLKGMRGVRRRNAWEYLRVLARDLLGAGTDALRWVRQVRDHRHELQFLLNRLFVVELGWGLAWSRALIDMVRGVPAIYLVFGNYDEVAHRRGPFSEQATAELFKADRALEELYTMGQVAPDRYDIILLTDHGHVDSVPFEQRGGQKLEPFLLSPRPAPLPEAVLTALRDGRELPKGRVRSPEEPVVIESGNFAHVYLTRGAEPLEALDLLGHHRDVLARAIAHPDIGIVALRRGNGAVAVVRGRVFAADEIDQAPLSPEFSRRAVADLLRELPHMKTAGDLVLFGEAVRRSGTVGFAWEFGSHGGLTRTETDSVVIWPSDAGLDLGGLSHSTQLHERLSEAYRH